VQAHAALGLHGAQEGINNGRWDGFRGGAVRRQGCDRVRRVGGDQVGLLRPRKIGAQTVQSTVQRRGGGGGIELAMPTPDVNVGFA